MDSMSFDYELRVIQSYLTIMADSIGRMHKSVLSQPEDISSRRDGMRKLHGLRDQLNAVDKRVLQIFTELFFSNAETKSSSQRKTQTKASRPTRSKGRTTKKLKSPSKFIERTLASGETEHRLFDPTRQRRMASWE